MQTLTGGSVKKLNYTTQDIAVFALGGNDRITNRLEKVRHSLSLNYAFSFVF